MGTGISLPVERVVPGDGGLGCLLLHGLTGTPHEMLPVAEALAGRHPLWVARMAGHATTVSDLAATSWQDWYGSALTGAEALLAVVPRLVVVGLSMGALLAVRLAVERPEVVAGLVLLSPAVDVRRRVVRRFGRPLRLLGVADAWLPPVRTALARIVTTKGGSDIADPAVRAAHPGYRQVPLRALLNLLALQREAWRQASHVTQPTLVVHARQDHTCAFEAAERFHTVLGTHAKTLVALEESFHVVTVDRERERVIAETSRWIEHLGAR